MLYYDRIDIRKGTDLAKSNNNKECMIWHCWFFNLRVNFPGYVCTGCHDLTMLSVNISAIAIITVKNVDYRCINYNISKSEDRGYIYKKFVLSFLSVFFFFFYFFCLVYIKWLIVWTPINL